MKDKHIQYRIRRARETYKDAQILFEMGSINSSVNRLYYSAFYAAIALMIDKDIMVRTHKGVQQKLGEEFVLKGQLSKDLAKAYSILADFRHRGDYNDLFEFDSEVIEKLFEPIAKFIDRIEVLLQK
jgi:uncharacterized protein (UPF0332 family)